MAKKKSKTEKNKKASKEETVAVTPKEVEGYSIEIHAEDRATLNNVLKYRATVIANHVWTGSDKEGVFTVYGKTFNIKDDKKKHRITIKQMK